MAGVLILHASLSAVTPTPSLDGMTAHVCAQVLIRLCASLDAARTVGVSLDVRMIACVHLSVDLTMCMCVRERPPAEAESCPNCGHPSSLWGKGVRGDSLCFVSNTTHSHPVSHMPPQAAHTPVLPPSHPSVPLSPPQRAPASQGAGGCRWHPGSHPAARHLLPGVHAAPTLVLPLLYVWIMFSAPCFTFSSMASCFSRPATRLRLVAEQAWLPAPGDWGASKEGRVGQTHNGPHLRLPTRLCPPERIHPLPSLGSAPKARDRRK